MGGSLERRFQELELPWRLHPQGEFPQGARRLGPGLISWSVAGGTRIKLESGELFVPQALDRGSCAPSGGALILESEGQLLWLQGGRLRRLRHPRDLKLLGALSLDERRFAFQEELEEGRVDLRLATLESGRLQIRRLSAARPLAPWLLSAERGQSLIFAERQGQELRLQHLSLESGVQEELARISQEPKILSSALKALSIAWMEPKGRVQLLDAQGQRFVGQSNAELLALSPNGDQIAWLEGEELKVRDEEGLLLESHQVPPLLDLLPLF